MFDELRMYTLVPGKREEYLRAAASARSVRGDDYGKLVGYFTAPPGSDVDLVNLWSHPSLEQRAQYRKELARNQPWLEHLSKIQPLLVTQDNRLLVPLAPLDPPSGRDHGYELTLTRTRVGKMAAWLDLCREASAARKRTAHLVGLWQTEFGRRALGHSSLGDLAQHALESRADVLPPSGRQEYLENLVNRFV